MSLLSVLSSCSAVVEQSKYVHIDTRAISNLLTDNSHLTIPPLTLGPAPYHFFDSTAASAEWLFLLDTVNHCFWPDMGSPRWTVHYNNEALSGYWALLFIMRASSILYPSNDRIPTTKFCPAGRFSNPIESIARVFTIGTCG